MDEILLRSSLRLWLTVQPCPGTSAFAFLLQHLAPTAAQAASKAQHLAFCNKYMHSLARANVRSRNATPWHACCLPLTSTNFFLLYKTARLTPATSAFTRLSLIVTARGPPANQSSFIRFVKRALVIQGLESWRKQKTSVTWKPALPVLKVFNRKAMRSAPFVMKFWIEHVVVHKPLDELGEGWMRSGLLAQFASFCFRHLLSFCVLQALSNKRKSNYH